MPLGSSIDSSVATIWAQVKKDGSGRSALGQIGMELIDALIAKFGSTI